MKSGNNALQTRSTFFNPELQFSVRSLDSQIEQEGSQYSEIETVGKCLENLRKMFPKLVASSK